MCATRLITPMLQITSTILGMFLTWVPSPLTIVQIEEFTAIIRAANIFCIHEKIKYHRRADLLPVPCHMICIFYFTRIIIICPRSGSASSKYLNLIKILYFILRIQYISIWPRRHICLHLTSTMDRKQHQYIQHADRNVQVLTSLPPKQLSGHSLCPVSIKFLLAFKSACVSSPNSQTTCNSAIVPIS